MRSSTVLLLFCAAMASAVAMPHPAAQPGIAALHRREVIGNPPVEKKNKATAATTTTMTTTTTITAPSTQDKGKENDNDNKESKDDKDKATQQSKKGAQADPGVIAKQEKEEAKNEAERMKETKENKKLKAHDESFSPKDKDATANPNPTEEEKKVEALLGQLVKPASPAEKTNVGIQGETTKTPYRLLKLLGEGQFGAVYQADNGKKECAVKMSKASGATDKEYRIMVKLKDVDAVVQVGEPVVLEQDGKAVVKGFAMEFANGGTLRDLIAKHKNGMPRALVKKLFMPLAEGLAEMHAKDITNRDIKPSNILVFNNANGQPEKLKFADFGLAEEGNVDSKLLPLEFNSAPEFPNICNTNPNLGPIQYKAVDVFAFGITLYSTLLGPQYSIQRYRGPRPREGSKPRDLSCYSVDFDHAAWKEFRRIYPRASTILKQMLRRYPEKRATAEKVVDLLKAWQSDASSSSNTNSKATNNSVRK